MKIAVTLGDVSQGSGGEAQRFSGGTVARRGAAPPEDGPVSDADLTAERRFFRHVTKPSSNCVELVWQEGNKGTVLFGRGRMKSGTEGAVSRLRNQNHN